MVSICIPTVRPQNIPNLLDTIRINACIPESEYEALWEEDVDRTGCAKTLKRLVAKAKGEKIAFVADDTLPEYGFLKEALACMERTGAYLVGFNDHHGEEQKKPTHWLADIRLLDHLEDREFFYTGYHHNGTDLELRHRAEQLGKYEWCKEAGITHNHPIFGTGPSDEHYERALDQTKWIEDLALFENRKKLPVRTKPLLGFVMIVKNEASCIEGIIASVKPFIDRWCILDTGSTDGTQDLIRKAFEGVEGNLYEEPFVDYGATRNRALDLLGDSTVFSLMLSGDETLENGQALRYFCERHWNTEEPAYHVTVHFGTTDYPSVRIARTSETGWRYHGVTHETMDKAVGDERNFHEIVPGASIFHDLSHRTYEGQVKRWEQDVELLKKELEKDPTRTRETYYLGQSLHVLGRYEEALEVFKKRVQMGGWHEERYEALNRMADCMCHLNRPWQDVQQCLLDAVATFPSHAEPILTIARFYRSIDSFHLAYLFGSIAASMPEPKDVYLFKNVNTYKYEALMLVGITAYYVGKSKEGREALEEVMRRMPKESEVYKQAEENLKFYLNK